MAGNLGQTRLRRRRRRGDPMQAYDALPQPLRRWMAGAALPWSPASCRRIWRDALSRGASVEDTLARLERAERVMLARDAPTPTALPPDQSPARNAPGLHPSAR